MLSQYDVRVIVKPLGALRCSGSDEERCEMIGVGMSDERLWRRSPSAEPLLALYWVANNYPG